MVSSVAFKEMRPLATFFVFEVLQSQMLSDGYGAAVGSDGALEAEAPVRVSKKSTHCFRSTMSKLDLFGQSHVISDVRSFI